MKLFNPGDKVKIRPNYELSVTSAKKWSKEAVYTVIRDDGDTLYLEEPFPNGITRTGYRDYFVPYDGTFALSSLS